MTDEDYDLAGFMVGVVEKDEALSSASIRPGSAVIGIPSSGVHSNGMSLVRKIFMKDGVHLPDNEDDRSFLLNQILLRPTLIYEPLLRPLLSENLIQGLVHVTGGGYYENIPRVLPEGVRVVIKKADVPVHPVFPRIQERGRLDDHDMFSVFNMGTGMIAFVDASLADKIVERINADLVRVFPDVETKARIIGSVEDRAGRELVEII
ncbi:MAG: hypothetical protein HY042_03450 [Spirochaetia bacterium]|nr:hypothetical protein [Spirochaetia bacterium]